MNGSIIILGLVSVASGVLAVKAITDAAAAEQLARSLEQRLNSGGGSGGGDDGGGPLGFIDDVLGFFFDSGRIAGSPCTRC